MGMRRLNTQAPGRRAFLGLGLAGGAALALHGLGCGRGGGAHHALFTFTNVDKKPDLQRKFSICAGSLFKHLSLPAGTTLTLHFVADAGSKRYGEEALAPHKRPGLDFVFHDKDELVQPILPLIETLRQHFSSPGGSYHDAIFFLSAGLHRVLPGIERLVKLDFDIMFTSSILDVLKEFDAFQEANVMGIGPELQPVYQRGLSRYRSRSPGTRAGSPLPGGMPGFNAGVMLLHLERMRRSEAYNAALEPAAVAALVEKYQFKGHLGDQDFYTLLGFEREELFYRLDCSYNRQLCEWWKDKFPAAEFDAYHACPGEPRIYHGNCSTPIPGAEAYEPAAAAPGSER
jgi:xylosyl alpha-1,3-xylosyltransferase